MIIEIVCYSLESAIIAQQAGASRIELCSGFPEGGTTPSFALIELVKQNLQIPVFVMIRPRGGDFLYTDLEFQVMKRDVEICKNLGIEGVVFGILNADGSLDSDRCKELVSDAYPMKVTLHRAFDRAADPFRTLDDAISCRFDRILTSGQQQNALEGSALIKQLIMRAAKQIIIMPGCGITEHNIVQLHNDVKASEYHLSGKILHASKMNYQNTNVSFSIQSGNTNEYVVNTDALLIKKVMDLLK